jgi:glutamate:Na+ symporter, ESS family
MPGSAEDIGLSFVSLTLVFASAALIRGWSRPLRALFIPTAVIAGFPIAALGPEGVGRLLGGPGIFPTETFAVWKALPGLLINVMCAALLLGERLPSLKTIWSIALSIPLIASLGLLAFTIVTVAATLTLTLWGIQRGHPR